MQLREIHIEGFGIFANTYISGLKSGINLLHGPNEFGKTTLLEFIRRILFGFPMSRVGTNPYPPLRGGAYGGKLVCEFKNGETVSIHRGRGTHGGAVTIQMNSHELTGQEEVDRLLGHTTKTFYENVYAISLEELQAVKSLDTEEVKSRIYGAGLGLGDVSLAGVKKEFKVLGDSLYTSRGRGQEMPLLYIDIRHFEQEIRKIQGGLGEYDDFVKQRDVLLEEVDKLDEKLRDLHASCRLLEHETNLYETYVDLSKAESELSELEELPGFPEDTLEKLNELKGELVNLEKQVNEKEGDLRILETNKDSCLYNEEIIKLESSMISLHGMSGKFQSAEKDIVPVNSERKELAEKIEMEIEKLGEGYSVEITKGFELKLSEEDKIRASKNSLDEANRRISEAKSKLEVCRENIARQSSRRFAGPNLYKYAMYAIVGLGFVGVVGGTLFFQWLLVGFSAFFFIIGISVIRKIGKGVQLEGEDPLEKKLRGTLIEAESQHRKLDEEWREFLTNIKFNEDLSPEGANEVVRVIEHIQANLLELDKLDNRIERMQKTIDEVKYLHDQVTPCIDESKLSDDIKANIEILSQHLEQAKDIKKNKGNLEERISELSRKINILKNNRDSKKDAIQKYISSLSASDEDDLKYKHSVVVERNGLSDKIEECKRIIQSTVGTGKQYDEFIKSISTTSPPEIESNLEELQKQIDELENNRTEKNQTIGKLRKQIEDLASAQDLLIKQSDCELKKQKLRDYSREWAKWRIALVMLNKAISKYEQTRQPNVIKAASNIFSHITNNRYQTLIKPAETNELRIRDTRGDIKGVIEMSRGTKEEMYFAMRLGLIKEYEKRSESMPVIMDDILVNFDDERGPLAIEALQDFAKERQVLVLTCHKNTLDIYKQYGVNEIIIT